MIPHPRSHRRGYTLVELLTVIAITAVLLTIIVYPVIQAFSLTRQAEATANAQDRARALSETIAREIGQAAAVRDPGGNGGTLLVRIPIPAQAVDASGATVTPVGAGTTVALPLTYAKLDLIPPAEGNAGSGPYTDPNTGKVDPTLAAPKGQVNLPLAPGQRLVRYFVGLRDPFAKYNNPYEGVLMQRGGGRDNLYVLYRAEVVPMVPGATGSPTTNAAFFAADANGRPVYDDPAFFLPNVDAAGVANTTDAKAARVRNWLAKARIVTEVSRFDQIQPEYDARTRLVRLDANGRPKLVPLLQFRPERVSNDPARGEVAVRLGEESDFTETAGPETYTTKFGAWSGGVVRLFPGNFGAKVAPGGATSPYYTVGRDFVVATGPNAGQRRQGVFVLDSNLTSSDSDPAAGTLVFDATQYAGARANGRRYAFSEALFAANGQAYGSALARQEFMPFAARPEQGEVRTSFSIAEVGPVNAAGVSAPNVAPSDQLPSAPGGLAYVPANDPTTTTGVFSDPAFASINARFNKIWNDALNNQNGVPAAFASRGVNLRFMDLRVTPVGDATTNGEPAAPLDPRTGYARARIVPGSEEIYGPDMSPGPNYGYEIRYRRTTKAVPGPNEYRLNYGDIPEPANYTTVWGTPNPPATYTPTDFVSAIIQPRYKAGFLVLPSEPNLPIPAQTVYPDAGQPTGYNVRPTRIRVSYRFQMTGPQRVTPSGGGAATVRNDVVAVDYDTRQLISVLLTLRTFPQSNLPTPPTVTLKATATARNLLR